MVDYTKPHQTRASDLSPAWHVIDAQGKTLGRLSSEIAILLQGKNKPSFVYYLNTGDFVIVVNADKVRVTGKKLDQKLYYRHSGYPGGLKQQTLSQLLQKAPTRVIKNAVKGMLPKNSLGRRMLSRLKLYAGDSHPHAAQVNARPKVSEAATRPEETTRAVEAEAPEAVAQPEETTQAEAVAPEAVAQLDETTQAEAVAPKAVAQPEETTQAEAVAPEAPTQSEETTQAVEAKAPPKTAAKAAKPKRTSKVTRKTKRPRAAAKPDAKDEGEAPEAAPEPEEA